MRGTRSVNQPDTGRPDGRQPPEKMTVSRSNCIGATAGCSRRDVQDLRELDRVAMQLRRVVDGVGRDASVPVVGRGDVPAGTFAASAAFSSARPVMPVVVEDDDQHDRAPRPCGGLPDARLEAWCWAWSAWPETGRRADERMRGACCAGVRRLRPRSRAYPTPGRQHERDAAERHDRRQGHVRPRSRAAAPSAGAAERRAAGAAA